MHKSVVIFVICVLVGQPFFVFAETEAEKRARIESELKVWEERIRQSTALVTNKQQERQSLERDLTIIDAEINKAQQGIQARALALQEINAQIDDKQEVIEVLNDRLKKQRTSLAAIFRQTQAADDISMIEILLSNSSLSEFFDDAEKARSIKRSLNESLGILREIRGDTEVEKFSLEEKHESEAEMKRIQELEKQKIQAREAEKENILAVTRGEEAAYQELLSAQKKTVAQLRAELFTLLGGGGQIPLPEAVGYAQVASDLTGTPASLILAILKQETDLGGNLGSCTMGDFSAGQEIMHPTRDMPVFLVIAETLGFDATTRTVSCPLRRADGSRIGWGGAMGPSQFIPSTWASYGGYVQTGSGWTYSASQDTIRAIRGKTTPGNPFDNQDAFLATALLLRDNGANGNYSSDRLAALRYYAGWGGASNPQNAFYGDGVMRYKAQFEQDIKTLSGG